MSFGQMPFGQMSFSQMAVDQMFYQPKGMERSDCLSGIPCLDALVLTQIVNNILLWASQIQLLVYGRHIYINLNRLINRVDPLSCQECQFSQWLLQKYKQFKAGTSNELACLPCWSAYLTKSACLVSLPALFVPATSTFVLLKWILCKLICIDQSTSLRYLWVGSKDKK